MARLSSGRTVYGTVPRGMLRAGIVALVTLVANVALVYQGARSTRAPTFSRGGEFIRRAPPPFAATEPEPSASAVSPAATDQPQAAGQSQPRKTVPLRGRAPTPAPTRAPDPAPAGPPALGVYTYRVQGTEGATGFGQRPYPEAMTLEAHRRQAGGKTLAPDEVVFDLDFQYPRGSGEAHTEREVVAFRPDGVYFTAESGQISFRGFGRTSDADYDPPMLQVPAPLQLGAQRAGKSKAVKPDKSVSRTEDWTVQVLRRETLTVLGQPVETWVVFVHRQSNPDASEKVEPRDRTYWYDPGRRIWVRWQEKFHGEQNIGVTFTYDTEYSATLAGFSPA